MPWDTFFIIFIFIFFYINIRRNLRLTYKYIKHQAIIYGVVDYYLTYYFPRDYCVISYVQYNTIKFTKVCVYATLRSVHCGKEKKKKKEKMNEVWKKKSVMWCDFVEKKVFFPTRVNSVNSYDVYSKFIWWRPLSVNLSGIIGRLGWAATVINYYICMIVRQFGEFARLDHWGTLAKKIMVGKVERFIIYGSKQL